MEHAVHDAGAARVGKEFAVIADEPARRRKEAEARLAGAHGAHVLQFALAQRDLLDDDAGIGIVDIDGDFLDRLQAVAVLVLLEQHARARDRQFEAFAAHVFDQHAELQFAAAGDFESALAGLLQLDGDIAFGFAEQAVADDAALHLVAFAPRQRGIVDRQRDRQRRRIDRRGRDRLFDLHVAQRVGHGSDLQPGNRDEVAGLGMDDRHARQAAEGKQLGGAGALDFLAVAVQHLDDAVDVDLAQFDAARQDAAEIGIGFDAW